MASVPAAAQTPASPSDRAREATAAQIAAWNAGDLETALGAYCPSPDITWVNRNGVSRGYEGFAQSMRAEFAAPAGMGALAIEIEHARDIGADAGLLVVRWSITRGGERLMGGVSTQLWAECEGRMHIVLEHAS